MKEKTRHAPPRAIAMLESLRGLGYSTGAALADIIDNSISAGSSVVKVDFEWDGQKSRLTITDDGRGMDDPELESAMRLGDKNPLDTRSVHDLGRFGMGLKTASFSQCRRLTVATIKNGVKSCLRWDLAALAANTDQDWLLFEGPAQGSETFIAGIDGQISGTVVLWESLDRIVTRGFTLDDFNDAMDKVQSHLAMVFHRLLKGPRARLTLVLNGQNVLPWDPFMSGHPAKPWTSPIAKIETEFGAVEVQCHVLPHRDKLSDEEFKSNAGPGGWTAQQGFYVYRNERLLLAGGWLGLGAPRPWNREEAHRLARIRLDIPNTADAEWKIDVRKSTARPPVSLKPWLTRLANETRDRARKVFAFRGTPTPRIGSVPIEQAWRLERPASGMRYRIEEKHAAVAAVLDNAGSLLPMIKAMLKVIEETVPVQRIWIDTAEQKETPNTGFSGQPPETVVAVLQTIFADMIGRRGMSAESAKRALLSTEPFQNFPELVATVANSSIADNKNS
jgi:hypothetical protein